MQTTPFTDAERAAAKARMRYILASELGYTVDAISDETDLREDLGADSLTIVELLAELADDLGIQVDVRILRWIVSRSLSTRFQAFAEQVLFVLEHRDAIERELLAEEAARTEAEDDGSKEQG